MPGLPRKILRSVARRALTVPRRVRASLPGAPEVVVEELLLVSSAGYQLRAHVHRPAGEKKPRPAVLLCPGMDAPGTAFDGWNEILNADELARLGIVVLHVDPAGRGESWGVEDYGGAEHQDDVAVALHYLLGRDDVVVERSGVVAVSMGIAMAVGALARHADDLPVGWLIDWEGPSDREIITAGGRLMAPALGHDLGDDAYWEPREAVRHVGRLRCGYFRFQAERDHAQPGEHRHALRMVKAAKVGRVPWFQLNDHAPGILPEEPEWYPSGYRAANRIVTRKIRQLAAL